MKPIKLFIFLWMLTPVFVQAQDEWSVPDDKKGILSQFAFTDSTSQLGAQIYTINCKSCHGDPGKGNFQNLNPLPSDPTTVKMQKNQDGELLYKIREGRGLMPSFKNILSTQQTWDLISYLRSLNSDYTQEIAEFVQRTNLKYSKLRIALVLLKHDEVLARVTGLEDGIWNPVEGADVEMFAHRMFGQLLLDEPKTTDNSGEVRFSVPLDLPGDTIGMIDLTAKLVDEEQFGPVKTDTGLLVGTPVIPVSLTEERGMWNTMKMAPVWLLIVFPLAVLIVWGLILFVLLQLRRIFYVGKE